MKPRPSPNIWHTPELYELENRAADPHDRIATAMREISDWTGHTVLDIGCGTGFHLPLWAGSAERVVGVEPHPPLVSLARRRTKRLANVSVLKGMAEALPVPDASVDVVISNCVINLSTDKPAVLAEAYRLLRPGGRFGVSDVVAEDHLDAAQRAARGTYVGCIAGALSRQEYLNGLTSAGFTNATVRFTHQTADGMHSDIIQATKPKTQQDRQRG